MRITKSGKTAIKASKSSKKFTGKSWSEFIANIESDGYKIDSAYRSKPAKWIVVEDGNGNSYDAEVTKYSDGCYELMAYNISGCVDACDDVKAYTDYDPNKFEKYDVKSMSDDELDELLTDIIDDREGEDEMSERGLWLDDLYSEVDNEIADRKARGVWYADDDVDACTTVKASRRSARPLKVMGARFSTETKTAKDAIPYIQQAIEILGRYGEKDDTTKDIIANLGVVLFDLKAHVADTDKAKNPDGVVAEEVGNAWQEGTIYIPNSDTVFKFEAKVFDEGSQFGIKGGRVSKLWIKDANNKTVLNYDRGWDVKPTTDEAKTALNMILKKFA